MIHLDADDRKEQIAALTTRYVVGEISETVYMVSLHRYCDIDDIRHLVLMNQTAHKNSIPYRKGLLE